MHMSDPKKEAAHGLAEVEATQRLTGRDCELCYL